MLVVDDVLSALGETINVMTLGGLALAVGILVDDATVTIENINCHLDMGKDVEPPSWTARAQIVMPAIVSLLCICIVFVPMFALGGVARYLFGRWRRRSSSRCRLLRAVPHAGADTGQLPAAASRAVADHGRHARQPGNPLVARSSTASSRFEHVASAIAACSSGARQPRARSSPASWRRRCCRFGAAPVARPELLPRRGCRPDQAACPRPDRHPHRGNRPALSTRSSRRSARSSRPRNWTASSTISACRSAASTSPTATPGPSGRRMPIS